MMKRGPRVRQAWSLERVLGCLKGPRVFQCDLTSLALREDVASRALLKSMATSSIIASVLLRSPILSSESRALE